MALDHHRIGDRFADILRGRLTEEQFREVRLRNRSAGPGVCHSHDFCDANIYMEQAFNEVMEREPDLMTDADVRLWNEAWNYAHRWHLTRHSRQELAT